jgi:hypothetical protein
MTNKQAGEDHFPAGLLLCKDVDDRTSDHSPACTEGQPCYRKD